MYVTLYVTFVSELSSLPGSALGSLTGVGVVLQNIMRALRAAKALQGLGRGPGSPSVSGDAARALSTSGLKDVLAEKIPHEQVR